VTFRAIPFALGLLVFGCGSKFVGVDIGAGGTTLAGDAGDAGNAGNAGGDASPEPAQGGTASGPAGGGGAAGNGGTGTVAGGGGVAGTSSSGGSAGACAEPSCGPSEEVCDGIDNDGDGVVDDNCVAALSVVFQQQLQPLGDANGGGAFSDDCPRGQVLAGLQARMDSHLTQIQGICREVAVTPTESAPLGYALTLRAAAPLPPHPTKSIDAISTLLCDAGAALVGFRVALEDIPFSDADGKATVITRLWVTCSKLVLVQRSDGAIAIEADSVKKELAPACGTMPKDTAPLGISMAPMGSLPTRLFGASGLWVDRIGIGASELQLAQ
jgi:hypothetical protein